MKGRQCLDYYKRIQNEFKRIQNLEQKNRKLKTKDIEKQITKTDKGENVVLPKE